MEMSKETINRFVHEISNGEDLHVYHHTHVFETTLCYRVGFKLYYSKDICNILLYYYDYIKYKSKVQYV